MTTACVDGIVAIDGWVTGRDVGAAATGGFSGLPNRNTNPTPAPAAINSQRVSHAIRPEGLDMGYSIQEALYRAEDYMAQTFSV